MLGSGLTEVVVPMPVETAPEGKQKAVYVDSQTAVKVLNRPAAFSECEAHA